MEDPLEFEGPSKNNQEARLRWLPNARAHGSELCRLSREVFGSGNMSDVTLTCRGGAAFYAHKIVLAAASTYFRQTYFF